MTTPDPFREWDAAYVLGALEPGDRRAYEAHLATCDACREAVAELAGLPGVLRLLPADEAIHDPAPPTAQVVRLADLARATRHARTRRTVLASVAAAVLLVGGVLGGVAVGAHTGSAPQAAATAGTQQVALAQVGASGVTADLVLTSKAWGTRLDWTCTYGDAGWSGDAAPTYELVVVDDAGTPTVVATWSAHAQGARGLGASTSVPTASIRSVEIRVAGGAGPLASGAV